MENEIKNDLIKVRVATSFKAKLKNEAQVQGFNTLSAYILYLMENANQKEIFYRRHDLADYFREVQELRKAMSRIGGNINQIAHALSIEEKVDAEAIKYSLAELHVEFQQNFPIVKNVMTLLKGD